MRKNLKILYNESYMEPSYNNFGSSNELPIPEVGVGQLTPESAPAASSSEVRGSQMPPLMPSVQAQNPMTHLPVTPVLQSVSDNFQSTGSTAGNSTLIADDADLIEKEWVIRAKAIVTQTQDDPHQQHREITKVKADYLKKRYNKDLKLSEN